MALICCGPHSLFPSHISHMKKGFVGGVTLTRTHTDTEKKTVADTSFSLLLLSLLLLHPFSSPPSRTRTHFLSSPSPSHSHTLSFLFSFSFIVSSFSPDSTLIHQKKTKKKTINDLLLHRVKYQILW